MKTNHKNQCGRMVDRTQATPAQEVLAEHGEIFSCGGVYLGLNRDQPRRPTHFQFMNLPNHQKETVVLNNLRVHRRSGDTQSVNASPLPENNSAESALRRFFKESLN